MNLEVRLLNERDYDNILVPWWKEWGWQAPEREFLPDNATGGLLIMEDSYPICAGFIYVTNSSVAWVDWIISSKSYRKKPHRKEAMLLLINSLTEMAREGGFKYCYALIKNAPLIETYKSLGYAQADTYNTEMIKIF